MGQKLLVPAAAVLLAIGAGVAIWFLMSGESPRTTPVSDNEQADSNRPADREPLQLNPADFDVSRIEPDPVASERPAQTFVPPKSGIRLVVSGRVVAEGGVGIADAEVTFTGEQKLRDLRGVGYTDAGGNFTLLAWASRETANAAGDPSGRLSARAPDGRIAVGESVAVGEDPAVTMPDLVVKEGATLTGQVLTDSGLPAPGALVTARSAGPVEVVTLRGRTPTSARRQYVSSVTADENGRFEFRQMPIGRYALQVEGGYFGFSMRAGEADLTAAPSAWLELRLTAGQHVRGVLKDQAGQPIAGAVVQLKSAQKAPGSSSGENNVNASSEATPLESNDRRSRRRFDDAAPIRPVNGRRCVTDSAGRFGFGPVPDADYSLVSKIGDQEAHLDDVKTNQPDYELQIQITTSVSGIVRDAETGKPLEVYDFRAMIGGNPVVTPFDRVSDTGRFEYHPGGIYVAANPSLKDTIIRISAPGYAPAFVVAGELREGDARRDLDVSLKPLCQLSFDIVHEGKKLDLEPVAMLFDTRLAYETSSDELGRVRVPDVSPASYVVKVVLADGTQLEGILDVPARRSASLELKLS